VEIKNAIIGSYESQVNKTKEKLFNYFIEHRLKNLMEHIGEF